ncbi:helix-turn-helix domain-containing protein [Calothrix sp. FACHB-1219]|uniref:helix-turn-helix domain-containing protein n=1 Tax=unclassified Calothrix TaxID=2619626 RepID=UPI0016850C3F|nr:MULTISPECIES: RodZ domain-containing protein [unclassified Calothrix]MBD2205785.1 helix-turn-helix domain-containing protein [Calothrix sp. FACHB-168]MBD2220614.1 helix-turn-helix domain-containing protein [Calothrix sp. FACHB-1219]
MKWFNRKDNQPPTLSVEQQQSEKLAEIGGQLWAARQEQGLSLEEVVILTRIPKRLLQAIEEGNLEELPEPVYLQGLIRQFADALGFNGVELSSTFPIVYQQKHPKPAWTNKPINQLRPLHLYFLYIFVIICSVSGLSQLVKDSALQASTTPPQPKAAQQKNSKQVLPDIKPYSNTLMTTKLGTPVQVGVTLKASSWIRVVADGKTEFEGTLPQGTQRTWKANEQLTVKTDNAGGVLMSVNQEQPKEMGELGKPEEVQIAARPRSLPR